MPTEIELAYIAGLIDGEAYIGIKKSGTMRNGRVNPAYQERIQIRMVDEEAIKFIAETLGGNYYRESASAAKGRPLYCFQASDNLAVTILKSVLPYLRVKKQAALTVLKLRNIKDNPDKVGVPTIMTNRWGQTQEITRWRYSPQHIEKCERLYLDCKEINRVGI